ncbi:MAG TPA: glycine--tRNA ligase subunit beta, partial [Candidatus Limnocylindrales bacterium]|nr:glycine--tRNA ligase subunit beta [Candidatus Limnocylindrales bacterium]
PALVAGLKFGKSMRWNASGVAFSRPIRWLVALIGEVVIPVAYAGVASGRITRGLRPYNSPEYLLTSSAEYFEVLRKQGIILSREARRTQIQQQVAALAAQAGGRAPEDPALLDEVTNLVEAPTALLGKFERRYLDLPREVLVTVMRKKQRYFAVEDAQGKLLPYFITVRNGDDQHLNLVAEGNEQVLRARFADAEYFFSQDTQKTLRDLLPRLNTLTFQEKLGSMFDKNQRVGKLVEPLGALLGLGVGPVATAQEAAAVLKADLATQMVVEMTSLQGTMGREYALRSGFDPAVANAIYEHWLPRWADDVLPQSDAGTLLSVADRLDSLVGLFAVGLAPQSTADPYGLRRAALGIIQIMIQKDISADLTAAVAAAADVQPVPVSAEVRAQVVDFIGGRLRAWLEDQGYPNDVLTAVLAAQSANPARALAGVRELAGWVARPTWQLLLEAFARCVRITRGESTQHAIAPERFEEPEETRLYEAYTMTAAQLTAESNVGAFLTAFEPMQPAIAAFFEKVLVNTPDEKLRASRLGLLQAISAMQQGRADLSVVNGF